MVIDIAGLGMVEANDFLLGEYRRLLDERYRLSVPADLLEALEGQGSQFVLAKEQPGALSLWHEEPWQDRHQRGMRLVQERIRAGRMEQRMDEVQRLGRLLSTRHRSVQLAGKGRLLIPEGFREFLGAEPGSEVLVIGAAVCLEIWRPQAWFDYLAEQIPTYRDLFDGLAG